MLIYVDDIIIISSSDTATERLLAQLRDDFTVKDLGTLNYFLGIEVHHNDQGLILTQEKYVCDLLDHTNMANCHGVPTPMLPLGKLFLDVGDRLSHDDATRYHSVVVALQYMSLTRPDISFAVNKVCHFMSSPTTMHWAAENGFFATFGILVPWAFVFLALARPFLVPIQIMTGPAMRMTNAAPAVLPSFFVAILCPGALASNL
jgi:hypothetical protein